MHERVAGEQAECPPARDLQELAHPLRSLLNELRLAWIGQVRRYIQNGLAGIVEMRLHNQLTRMFDAQAPADIVKPASNCQRRRRKHSRLEMIEQRLAQDVRH